MKIKVTEYLVLEDLVRIVDGGKVRWEVTANGKKVHLKSTSELFDRRRFAKRCIEQINIYPLPIDRDVWEDCLRDLGNDCREREEREGRS
jgi:hypothetical protein